MIQLSGYPTASFNGSHALIEPELEAMLRKTVAPGEGLYLKVQSAPGEAFVLTQLRVIILKGAKRDPAGRGYGRFFELESITRFECRGWFQTNFIAVITIDTVNEVIPSFNLWKCSFGTTFDGDLGQATANYLKPLEQWIADQRRRLMLQGPLQTVVPTGIVPEPGEQFYLEVPAAHYEEKSFRQYVGGSSGVSIPVIRGVRMRVGATRGVSTTQSIVEEDDRGTLVIGDYRVVFAGHRRNISIPLRSIASVEAFTNGFQLAVANKKATRFRTDNDIPGLLLKRLLQIP